VANRKRVQADKKHRGGGEMSDDSGTCTTIQMGGAINSRKMRSQTIIHFDDQW
jgi:hypothetical protein